MKSRSILCLCVVALVGLVGSAAEAETKPFSMVGWGVAPEGLSLVEEKPHWSVGKATGLGPHGGRGTFKVVSPPVPQLDPAGNLVGLTADFTSGSTGYSFFNRRGVLATDYGFGSASNGVPGKMTIKILEVDAQGIALCTARFLANFQIDSAESRGQFAGCSGNWLMDARSARPFRLNLVDGTSEPFAYVWFSVPGTGNITCP